LWELEVPVAFAADLFNQAGMGWVEEPYRLSDAHRIRARDFVGPHLLEPWLVESHTTVIIPLDDHVIFVRWLNRTIFSGRLSEVAQTLGAISGMQLLVGRRELGKRWLPGAA
jgi:hypothetical protein